MFDLETIKPPIRKLDLQFGATRLMKPLFGAEKVGKYVAVRRAGENQPTKLGLYIGDIPMGIMATRSGEDAEILTLSEGGMGNPAIYVFDEQQLVYGMESWWTVIDTPEKLKQITDADINNVWYVQALKALSTADAPKEPGE